MQKASQRQVIPSRRQSAASPRAANRKGCAYFRRSDAALLLEKDAYARGSSATNPPDRDQQDYQTYAVPSLGATGCTIDTLRATASGCAEIAVVVHAVTRDLRGAGIHQRRAIAAIELGVRALQRTERTVAIAVEIEAEAAGVAEPVRVDGIRGATGFLIAALWRLASTLASPRGPVALARSNAGASRNGAFTGGRARLTLRGSSQGSSPRL